MKNIQHRPFKKVLSTIAFILIFLFYITFSIQAQQSFSPIFNPNPTSANPLIIQENFEDFVYKGIDSSGNEWRDYGPQNSDKQWRNTGNNNFQLVSTITDGATIILPREGSKAIKWTVDANDIGSTSYSVYKQNEWRRRSEIGNISNSTVKHAIRGTEYWYGISIYVPSDFKYDSVGEIHFQLHAEDVLSGANPPVALIAKNDKYYLHIRGDDRPNFSQQIYQYQRSTYADLGNIPKGQWTDWAFHVRWSYKNTENPNDPQAGYVQIYKNKSPLLNADQQWGANDLNTPNGTYIKFGIYKSSWGDSGTQGEKYRQESASHGVTKRIIYHDSLRVTKRLPEDPPMSLNGLTRVSPLSGSSLTITPSPFSVTITNTPLSPTGLPTCQKRSVGDSDCNDMVNLPDFEQWRKEFTGSAQTKNADFNASGTVTMSDFEIWRRTMFLPRSTLTPTITPV